MALSFVCDISVSFFSYVWQIGWVYSSSGKIRYCSSELVFGKAKARVNKVAG